MRYAVLSMLCFALSVFAIRAQNVSKFNLELESHTRWEAVDSKWKELRDQWVANCKKDNDPQQSARLLLQFEANVKWDAVESTWSNRRTAWVQECNQAATNAQVAKLLLQLESNIKWSAVDDNWKTRRTGWVSELNGIVQAPVAEKNNPKQETGAYKSVVIGRQTWMLENLDVDKFRNGDPIPQAKTEEEWKAAKENKQPAWWYCGNDPANAAKCGKLYNWYAVNDPRGLTPAGWRIPTEDDWTKLELQLGLGNGSVSVLKSTTGWADNKNGTNESGFSAFPGGNSDEWKCYNKGKEASWWSSTVYTTQLIRTWSVSKYDMFVMNGSFKYSGNSVRCIKE